MAGFIATGPTYSYSGYSICVEDTKGKKLYEQQYETKDAVDSAFESLKVSEDPYSFETRTYYPVQLDVAGIVVPNATTMLSGLNDRIGQVVFGILFGAIDLITLPIRLITLIPYTFCWKQDVEHKIAALIRQNPEASLALKEKKVVLYKREEVFAQITPGRINDQQGYMVSGGRQSEESKEVYLAPSLSDHAYKSSRHSTSTDGFRLQSIKRLSKAFI